MIVMTVKSMSREENHSRISVYTHLTILGSFILSISTLVHILPYVCENSRVSPLKHKCNASKGLLRVVVVDRPNDGMKMKMKRIDVMHV